MIDPTAQYGHSLRILSWDASLSVIKTNWLFGVGEGNKENVLVETYILKGYTVPAKELFNSHNQYLDFLLGGGIIGLGLFAAGIGSLLIGAFKEENFPLMAFLLIFCFGALFENFLTCYAGVLLFSTFTCLLSGKSKA